MEEVEEKEATGNKRKRGALGRKRSREIEGRIWEIGGENRKKNEREKEEKKQRKGKIFGRNFTATGWFFGHIVTQFSLPW